MIEDRALTNYDGRKQPARHLRKSETKAESILWARLRNRKLGGLKFRRQFPMGLFFADFCCFESRLVVELEGHHDADAVKSDGDRTSGINEFGFRVIRFWNEEVLIHLDDVCERILKEAQSNRGTLSPLPEGEGTGKAG